MSTCPSRPSPDDSHHLRVGLAHDATSSPLIFFVTMKQVAVRRRRKYLTTCAKTSHERLGKHARAHMYIASYLHSSSQVAHDCGVVGGIGASAHGSFALHRPHLNPVHSSAFVSVASIPMRKLDMRRHSFGPPYQWRGDCVSIMDLTQQSNTRDIRSIALIAQTIPTTLSTLCSLYHFMICHLRLVLPR
jgi:hypothetical protein